MTTLALDLGTATGFAWRADNSGTLVSGTWSLKPGKYDGGGIRFVRFIERLNELHHFCPITHVVFEAVRRHIGTDAAHVYGGLMGTLQAWCEQHAIPYEGVPVGTIKKFWTGKGNASKDEMIEKAVQLGYAPADDNEADAIALLCLKCPENPS